MKKELPGLFANKINKKLENNERVVITKPDEELVRKGEDTTNKKEIKMEKNINQKIQDIFSSPKYVYKADVSITTKDKKITKKIVGKNNNNLITIENELIPISDIVDIEFQNKS